MLTLLRVLSFVPIILAAKMRREERRLVEWFRARGAFDGARAVTLSTDGAIARFVQQRLERGGALRSARGLYYFDETNYAAFRARRRQRVTVIVAALSAALVIAFLAGVISL